MKSALTVAVGLAVANYSMAFFSATPEILPNYAVATQITWHQLTAIFACWVVNKAFYGVKDES